MQDVKESKNCTWWTGEYWWHFDTLNVLLKVFIRDISGMTYRHCHTVNHQLWYLDRLLQVHHLWLFCLPPSLFMVLCFAISSFVVFASIQSWSWRAWSWAGTLDSLMWPISKAWQRKGYIRGNMSQSNKSIHQSQWEPSNQTGLHIKKSLAILGWCCWYVPGTWSVISSIIPISTSATCSTSNEG